MSVSKHERRHTQEEIFALQRAAQDPEKVKRAHKEFLAWKALKDAGKLPLYELRNR